MRRTTRLLASLALAVSLLYVAGGETRADEPHAEDSLVCESGVMVIKTYRDGVLDGTVSTNAACPVLGVESPPAFGWVPVIVETMPRPVVAGIQKLPSTSTR